MLDEVTSSSSAELQAVKMLAKYLQGPSKRYVIITHVVPPSVVCTASDEATCSCFAHFMLSAKVSVNT